MSTLKIPTARVFEPLLAPARYKAAYGGRGSGKSHFFGELLVETCQAEPGTLAVCIREAQRTLAQSSKRLIESKVAGLGLGHRFKVYSDKIATPGDGLIIFRGMQDHTADSIKSLEGFRIAWIDEAQSLSARSLSLLRPTIRAQGSELWASWNPRRRSDAIDDFFRARQPAGAVAVMRNTKATPPARIAAANAILDRGWGKAPQAIQSGDDGALKLIHRIERVIVDPENPDSPDL